MKDQFKDEKEYTITAYHDDECTLKMAEAKFKNGECLVDFDYVFYKYTIRSDTIMLLDYDCDEECKVCRTKGYLQNGECVPDYPDPFMLTWWIKIGK